MSYSVLATILSVTTAMGCASASSGVAQGDDASTIDDAGGNSEDATGTTSVDTMPMIDAAPACVTMTKNLLTNGNFDSTPVGTGWTATPYQAGDQLITTAPLIHSSPNAAWLGGLNSSSTSVKASDVLYADIAVPASASTPLALTGFYEVRTSETSTTNSYDSVKVDLLSAAGVVLATPLEKSNVNKTTVFTALDMTFAETFAGQTVRLRFTTSSDFSNPTSFYFDTLALNSTICE